MANAEHVELIKQGVDVWNRWRIDNPKVIPELSGANLSGIILSNVNLIKANLTRTNLVQTKLGDANLSEANLSRAYLRQAFLRSACLRNADLSKSRLPLADLRYANLSQANLSDANLRQAHVLGTNLSEAVFTGACLQDWNINSATNFDGAICEYVYFKSNQQERRPREGNFKPGEFAALFQQAVDTVDLIFTEGIDWQAFSQSFQNLRSQYADENLFIQGIERKQGEAFVIRLAMPPESDKTAIESCAKELYAAEIKEIESQYEERLQLQGQHLEDARQTIEIERRDKATLMGVMATLATSQQGPKYVFNQSQFAGGFAETVQGQQLGGTINTPATKTPSLTEATTEIQNLLAPLEASNPTATQSDQIAFLNLIIPPPQRERFISALQSTDNACSEGSEDGALQSTHNTTNTALEDIPYAPLLKALVKSWQLPGSEE